MQKFILTGLVALVAAATAFSQQTASTNASAKSSGKAAVSKNGNTGAASLAAGTQIAGQLQSTLDAKNAKVGDEVILKTTNAIKENGQVVVQKGAKLIGHVTEVQQKAKNNAGSKIGVLFDTLQQGGNSLAINTIVTSVTQAATAANIGAGGDDLGLSGSGTSSTTTSTSTRSSGGSSGGGLLGGVGNTVGGVVNSTTQTVGGVANTAGNAVGGVTNTAGQTLGSTTQAVGGTVRGLQISQSTDASASGGSTLSLGSGNLRLDKGATFNLSVSQSSSVKAN